MNASTPVSAPAKPVSTGRRVVRWVLISAGICLVPILALAAVVASCFMLDGDGVTLRKHVMAATGEEWNTTVQMSVGRGLIGAAATGLCFVREDGVDDARLALNAVRRASVGVYERTSKRRDWSRQALFARTDAEMAKRGWSRLVGVADGDDTVLIYAPHDAGEDDEVEVCLAVLSGDELVVVSTTVDADALMELAVKHSCDDFKKHVRLAGLRR